VFTVTIDREKIKELNGVSITTQNAALGDLLLFILESLETNKTETPVASECVQVQIPSVPNTKATTIKELASDYNKLLTALREAGLMAE
jgi:hypothetical protein